MVAIFYWRICLLFVVCGCQVILDEEEISNDDQVEVLQQQIRIKSGTLLTLKCRDKDKKANWYFKPCDINVKETECIKRNWKKMEHNITKGRLRITANNGLYKCTQNKWEKIFVLNVVDSPSYNGSSPLVYPLEISNITAPINMEFTIQCKAVSKDPATIFWFKTCNGHKCDIRYNSVCYCHINTSISENRIGTTYVSKYFIFNARAADSGTYICAALNKFGETTQNVTISVPYKKADSDWHTLLFLIPLGLLLIPLTLYFLIMLCYSRRKKKSVVTIIDQQKQLIRHTGQVNEII